MHKQETTDPNGFDDSPFEPFENIMHLIEKNGHAMEEEPAQSPTDDEELRNDPEYQKVIKHINSLWESGVIRRGSNHCLSMSDLIYNVLKLDGIKSRVVECKLTVLGVDPPGFSLVGHNGLMYRTGGALDPNNYDTHVICITETKIPMLIDLSINHLRKEVQFICERLNGDTVEVPDRPIKDKVIGYYNFGASIWTYQIKEKSPLMIPELHQRSIIDRIRTDQKIANAIKWLFILNIIGIAITLANAIRGIIDFIK